MMQLLQAIQKEAENTIKEATNLKTLDAYRIQYLGKKSQLTEYLKEISHLPLEDRPAAGQKVNAVKEAIQNLIKKRASELEGILIAQQATADMIDVTLAGRAQQLGSIHPIMQTIEALHHIFLQMGFFFMEGPEIEDDYYNFAALNIPAYHPARAMQDTFYFPNNCLLRTHMSPVQIRAMKAMNPPLRVVSMGRVYRRDFDMTHTPMFHQLEALLVDENLSFANLKSLMSQFLRAFFSDSVEIRFRPSYFPFTEPSAEVDISCFNCSGQGCRICKQTGWLEVLGCGMVHPNVLDMAGIDSARYRGLACGVGIDRLTLLKHGISDLRSLFESDIRFLSQF